ncbi:hypothetical protein [Acetobacter persici]|uniref:hypothetical protein n=1 Tax=Acetobacter persici TaxID=1076596 RepID=UPI001BAC8E4F|nr:hypothetical protein [Acetobacter persici]MBS1014502.1 hypothetical protein [Acetobacter persici]
MSGTNATDTTASGAPLSSLPAADVVAQTDGIFGVFAGEAKLATPSGIVEAGMPDDVVRTKDMDDALSSSALGQYVAQAGQHAADAGAGADRSQVAAAASSASAAQAAQAGVQVATIAAGATADADRAQVSQKSAESLVAGAGAALGQNTVLASLVANNPAQFTNRGAWDAAKNSPALISGTGTEGDLYIVTVEGTTTLDGISSWAFLDGVWFHQGAWLSLPRAGYPSVAQAFQALREIIAAGNSIGPSDQNAWDLRDIRGFLAASIDHAANLSLGGNTLRTGDLTQSLESNGWRYALLDATGRVGWGVRNDGSPAFPVAALSADLGPVSFSRAGYGFRIVDSLGRIVFPVQPLTDLENPEFTASQIAARDRENLARSAAVMAGPGDLHRARPVWGLSLSIADGQSVIIGYLSVPVRSLTQPYDNLMFGDSIKSLWPTPVEKPWTPVGNDPTPKALVATNFDSDANAVNDRAYAPVYLQPNDVTLTVHADKTVTITTTDTACDFTTQFRLADNIQCAGFTGDAAVNNLSGGQYFENWFTITAVAAQSITATPQSVWQDFTPASVAGATGITIAILWPAFGTSFGEDQSISALNFFRGRQLAFRGLLSDSARRLVLASTGIGGMSIAQLSKGSSPDLYRRNVDVTTILTQQAKKLGATCGVFLIEWLQGENDITTDYEDYTQRLTALHEDMIADIRAITGQKQDPFFEMGIVSGIQMPTTGIMDVVRAQVDYGLNTPGAYVVSAVYPAIDYFAHLPANSQRWFGALRGKIRHRVITQGLAWKPLVMTGASLSGCVVLVDCHVPYPPLQIQTVWIGQQQKLFNDLGFMLFDAAADEQIMVQRAEIVGDCTVRLILSRAPTNPQSCWVLYADNWQHQGSGNIFDSDPEITDDVYEWSLGDGSPFCENHPDLIGRPMPLANPMVPYALKITEGN